MTTAELLTRIHAGDLPSQFFRKPGRVANGSVLFRHAFRFEDGTPVSDKQLSKLKGQGLVTMVVGGDRRFVEGVEEEE